MEQEVETGYRPLCSTCLSSDRNLISINCINPVHQVFRILMSDFAGERFGETAADAEQLVCWECLALMRRFARFKRQVQSAQEHLRILALSPGQETLDHQYMSHSLSSLEMVTRVDYDKIFFDYSTRDEWQYEDSIETLTMDHVVKNDLDVEMQIDEHSILGLPEIVLEGSVMPHLVVSADDALLLPSASFQRPPALQLAVSPITDNKLETVIVQAKTEPEEQPERKIGYITTYLSEEMMQAAREEDKQKVQYASSGYKCELCIVGFYSQQQVKEHFMSMHRPKEGCQPCRVCFVYVEESKLSAHIDTHYTRHTCNSCGRAEHSALLMAAHVRAHAARHAGAIAVDGTGKRRSKKKKCKLEPKTEPPQPGDLRKLLSKTVIEGYQCLECEMFFKSSRARKTHVMRFHREGFQCDHCQKRFVNKTTLATHLRLHDGPLPREECPICHKMVRSIQIKYHIRRHENKQRFECEPCKKVFSFLATYQAHLKYSRAHASEDVFKFPCPMCNKGYPTKEQMQDHFNYNHLGKTLHRCPICEKPISSRSNVDKHIARVHRQKKERPRSHLCAVCRRGFTDRKSLVQHEAVHSGERPLACDICQQTFKQKASLYTHRKRVHKVFPQKRDVYFMEKIDA